MPSSFLTAYYKVGLTADTYVLLIDLSDTTFPHGAATGTLILEELVLSVVGTAGAAGVALLQAGIVKEADATNGTWFPIASLPVTYNTRGDMKLSFGPKGLNVSLSGAGATAKMQEALGQVSGDLTNLQTDAGDLEDAEGNTTKSAGAGDLLLVLDETTDGGTYAISATVTYRVQ